MSKILFILLLFISSVASMAQDTTRLSLLFLGDIMQHGSQISAAYDPVLKKYDYDPCFKFIKPYIQAADISIANLEVTLAGKPYSGYPQFSAPDELLSTLKDAGFDVLVTANNHCVDKGKKGLERTISMLDSFNIPHTGTFVDETNRLNEYPLVVEKNGFKIALLNYTFSTNGLPVAKPNIVNRIDTTIIHKDLIKAKTYHADAIIVFTHWGIEYQSLPSPEQKRITDFCFDHGADLVIGAHPHVIQPMEWRKETDQLVAYSLGNFVSGQRKRYTDGGATLNVELQKISYSPDSSVTNIKDAGYMLQWIYKTTDSNKDYYILPVRDFEKDTLNFIKDNTSKLSLKTFSEDSRSLFNSYNKNIREGVVIQSSQQYFVEVRGIDSLDGIYGTEEITDSDGVRQILIGPFSKENDAMEIVSALKLKYPDKLFQIIIR